MRLMRLWTGRFWKRELTSYHFLLRGDRTRNTIVMETKTNYEPPARGEANDWFERRFGEKCTLLAVWIDED